MLHTPRTRLETALMLLLCLGIPLAAWLWLDANDIFHGMQEVNSPAWLRAHPYYAHTGEMWTLYAMVVVLHVFNVVRVTALDGSPCPWGRARLAIATAFGVPLSWGCHTLQVGRPGAVALARPLVIVLVPVAHAVTALVIQVWWLTEICL